MNYFSFEFLVFPSECITSCLSSSLTRLSEFVTVFHFIPLKFYFKPLFLWSTLFHISAGTRNTLITFTFGSIACSLFCISEFQPCCHWLSAWVRMIVYSAEMRLWFTWESRTQILCTDTYYDGRLFLGARIVKVNLQLSISCFNVYLLQLEIFSL